MDGYRLQAQQMTGLISDLVEAAESIEGANNRLKDASPTELGSHEIDRAGRAFQDRWEHGTEKIAEATEGMVAALQQTQRAYQTIEDEIARIFPSTGGAATPGMVRPDSAISQALNGDPQ